MLAYSNLYTALGNTKTFQAHKAQNFLGSPYNEEKSTVDGVIYEGWTVEQTSIRCNNSIVERQLDNNSEAE